MIASKTNTKEFGNGSLHVFNLNINTHFDVFESVFNEIRKCMSPYM